MKTDDNQDLTANFINIFTILGPKLQINFMRNMAYYLFFNKSIKDEDKELLFDTIKYNYDEHCRRSKKLGEDK